MFQKKLFFIISLLCFNGQAWTGEAPRESGFFNGARDSARRFTDKYLGSGNFFREREEAEKVEEERNQDNFLRDNQNNQEHELTPVNTIQLSNKAIDLLTDLHENVLKTIVNDKDLRKEMDLLLPHNQLYEIVGTIIKQQSITEKDINDLQKLKNGVRLNLKDPNIFDVLIRRSKLYSTDNRSIKIKKYQEIFTNLLQIAEKLSIGNEIKKELQSVFDLFSDQLYEKEKLTKLKDDIDSNLKKIEISRTWYDIIFSNVVIPVLIVTYFIYLIVAINKIQSLPSKNNLNKRI